MLVDLCWIMSDLVGFRFPTQPDEVNQNPTKSQKRSSHHRHHRYHHHYRCWWLSFIWSRDLVLCSHSFSILPFIVSRFRGLFVPFSWPVSRFSVLFSSCPPFRLLFVICLFSFLACVLSLIVSVFSVLVLSCACSALFNVL